MEASLQPPDAFSVPHGITFTSGRPTDPGISVEMR